MSTPAYEKYKESGVEWLGKVPEHWEVKPIKYVASFNDEVLPESTPDDYQIEYADISSVSGNEGIKQTETHTFKSAPSRARRRVQNGDVIVSTVRTYLRAIASIQNPPENLIVSTGFAVLRPLLLLNPGFAAYLFNADFFIHQIIAYSVGISYPAINASDLVNISAPLPPLAEQRAIASYLDRETARLDTLISRQERLIELSLEKRRALIGHAVTRGLDETAPRKASGVEWLGDVPAHWEIKRTKYLFDLVADVAPDDNEYELLSVYTDIGVKPRKELQARGNKSTTTDGYWMVERGDLIVNKLLAWMGAMGASDYKGVTSPAYDILRPRENVNVWFYHDLFRCGVMFTEFRKWSRGIMDMRLRLYFDQFGVLPLPLPPKGEQDEIVSYISSETAKIDTLIAKARRAIELMKEHRSALIAAAVTGQMDVRAA